MSDVKVYMLANLQIHDAEKYRLYEKGFFPILKKHNGEFITYDDNIVHIEGQTPMKGRIILFSFPSAKYADEWYSDPEYQAISEHRRNGTTAVITMINGLPSR